MAISDRITSIEEHIKESYQELEGIGIDTTGVNKNLENIPKLIDGYWETLPKVTGEGTSITLDNTKEGKMKIVLKGNTSQEGTPTPETPQDIHVVSGDNSIEVCGKNLAPTNWASDYVSRVNDSSKASLVTEDNRHCVFFLRNTGYGEYDTKYFFKTNWKENTQYTVSFYIKPTATQSNLSFLYTGGTNKTLADNLIANVWQKLTVTSLANKTLERIQGYWASGEDYVDIDTFMVEEGTQATTYEAYKGASYPINLGDIELCKIGTYQDKIFKNTPNTTDYDSNLEDNVWYVKKEIGKVVLDGSENWFQNGTYPNVYGIDNFLTDATTTETRPMLSDYFTYGGLITNGSGEVQINKFYQWIGMPQRLILGYNSTSLADFKTWLGNNKPIINYPLNTPTYTEITDSTLISQLEALEKGKSYTGQTNISQESNDLASLLNATALEEME